MATVTVDPVAATILSALIAAAPGDTILVRPGVVTGQISRTTTLDKRGSGGVTIKPEIPNNPPRFAGSPRMFDLRNVHGVRFEKLIFERKLFDGAGYTDGGGVDLQTCAGLTFFDCTFEGGMGQLYAMACADIVVEWCEFRFFGAKPLRLYGNCANAIVRNNKFRFFAGDPTRLSESARTARVITVALTNDTAERPPSGVKIYNNEIVISEPGLIDVMGIVAWSPNATNDATLATYGHRNLEIYGNYIEGGAYHGIHINRSLSGVIIRDNALVETPSDDDLNPPRVYISSDSARLLQKGQTITNNSSGLAVGPGTPLVNGSIVGHRTPDTQRPIGWIHPVTGPGGHTSTQLDPAPAQLVEPSHVEITATYTAGTFGSVVYYSGLVAVPNTSLAWRADPDDVLLRWTDDAIGPLGRRLEFDETVGTTHYYRMTGSGGSATEYARPVGAVDHDGIYFSYRDADKNNWSAWSAYTDGYTTPAAPGEVHGVVVGGSEMVGDARVVRDPKAAAGGCVGAGTLTGNAHVLSSTGGVVGVVRGAGIMTGTAQRVANAFAGAGAAAGVAAVSGHARLVGRVQGAVVGSGSCAGSATVVETYAEAGAGEIVGAAAVSGSAKRTRQVTAGATGGATVAALGVRVRQAVGAVVGAGAGAGLARRVRSIAGQAEGAAIVAGRGTKPGASAEGQAVAGSTMAGQVTRTRRASGAAVGGASAAGLAKRFRLARGAAVGAATLLVAGDRAFRVRGAAVGGSAVLGAARIPHPLWTVGAARGSSALVGRPSATFSVRATCVGRSILTAVLARRTRAASGHAVGGSTMATAPAARSIMVRGAAVGRSRMRGRPTRQAGADLLILVDLPTVLERAVSIRLPRPVEETWRASGLACGEGIAHAVATGRIPVAAEAIGAAVARAAGVRVRSAQGYAIGESIGEDAFAVRVKPAHGVIIGTAYATGRVGATRRASGAAVGGSVAEATSSAAYTVRGAAVGGAVAQAAERVEGTAPGEGRAIGAGVLVGRFSRVRRGQGAAVGRSVAAGDADRGRRTLAHAVGGAVMVGHNVRVLRAEGHAVGGSVATASSGAGVGVEGTIEGGAIVTGDAKRTRRSSGEAIGRGQVTGQTGRIRSAQGAAVGGSVVIAAGARGASLYDKISGEMLYDKISGEPLDYAGGVGGTYSAQGSAIGGAVAVGRPGKAYRTAGAATGGATVVGSATRPQLLLDKISGAVLKDKISNTDLTTVAA